MGCLANKRQLAGRPVVLVGRRIRDNENLGLAYLRASLEQSGFEVETHYLNNGRDVAGIANRIMDDPPRLLGISLADGGSSFLPLALGELLQRRGYAGHITCGGQFATLAEDWLLERYQWLDSVIRFAGEVPLVELAHRLESGDPLIGIPALTTRGDRGAPAPVLDATPLTLRPHRDELPEILGTKTVHICASRGCKGRCAYCGPAALQNMETAEGRAGGASHSQLRIAGVGGVRRRALESLCDEMADLWHRDGVRYFYFVDEHLLPYAEDEALAYLETWDAGLRARKVGKLGVGTMLRADRLTPRVAARFAELGLIRTFMGFELSGTEQGRQFARRIDSEHNLRMLSTMHELGVATVANLMLVNPESTEASILEGIELLDRVPAGVFEATRMMVYHGTQLCADMSESGRLFGNPLRYGYVIEDPVAERFSGIFTRLRGEAFMNYSIAHRTHDVFLSMALAKRLSPERDHSRVQERLESVRSKVNSMYVSAYRDALAMAQAGGDFRCAQTLITQAAHRSRFIERQLAEIESQLSAVLERPLRGFSPMRHAAAAVFTFALLGSSACSGRTAGGASADATGSGSDTSAVTPIPTPPPSGTDTSETEAPETETEPPETETEPPETETEPPLEPDVGEEGCSEEEVQLESSKFSNTVTDAAPCFHGGVWMSAAGEFNVEHWAAYGNGDGFRVCYEADPDPQTDAVLQALEAEQFPCLIEAGQGHWEEFMGGNEDELVQISDAFAELCPQWVGYWGVYTIHIDDGGFVTGVTPEGNEPEDLEVAACVETALDGLQFPCLAGYDVCPEFIIGE
jgi:radical SAM superfamily enzyme YgiQ (UPF0313 family)